jgi:uncharacterized membrane protein
MQTRSREYGIQERTNGGGHAVTPWAELIGGSALALFGMTRRNLRGTAMALAGGYLVYRGATAERAPASIQVRRSITIYRQPEEVFRFWRNLENLPRFMSHLESVQVTGNRWSKWTARGPAGTNFSWQAEITDERENEYIVWRSLPDSEIENLGSVQFRRGPADRGTEVVVSIEYRPPAGRLGLNFAKLFGKDPEWQIREDLRHFKQLLEAGEIARIEGQPHGRRSAVISALQRVYSEPRPTGTETPRSYAR